MGLPDGYFVFVPLDGIGGDSALDALNSQLAPCGFGVQYDFPGDDMGYTQLLAMVDSYHTESEAKAVVDAARVCVPEITSAMSAANLAEDTQQVRGDQLPLGEGWYVVLGTGDAPLSERINAQLEPCGLQATYSAGGVCGLTFGYVGIIGGFPSEESTKELLEAAKLCVPDAYVEHMSCTGG